MTSSGITSLLTIKCLFEQLKTVYIYNNNSIFCELSMGFNLEFPQFYPQWHSFSYIVINNFQEMLKI